MMQMAMTALFALIVAGWSAMASPQKYADVEMAIAETTVAQFMDYRAAAIRYVAANPVLAEGVLNNGLISAYALPGTAIGTKFSAYWKTSPGGAGVAEPGLYVYSMTAIGVREASVLSDKMSGSLLFGIASGGGTKYIISPVGNTSTVVLPAAANIQPGSLVAFGR